LRRRYTGKLDSEFALFGAIQRLAVKQNVARHFQALADEIERRSTAGRAQSGGLLPLNRGGSTRVLAALATS
jgi:hypothetical protein